jgi:hypothetical protein
LWVTIEKKVWHVHKLENIVLMCFKIEVVLVEKRPIVVDNTFSRKMDP